MSSAGAGEEVAEVEGRGARLSLAVAIASSLWLAGCVSGVPGPEAPAGSGGSSAGSGSPSVSPTAGPSGRTQASPDFDGDGGADVVAGMGSTTPQVSIRYFNGHSQSITRRDLDGTDSYGFGQSVLARDLNGDGYTDLVVADADQSFDQSPALFFIFGSAAGLQPATAKRVAVQGLIATGALALVTEPSPVLAVSHVDNSVLLFELGADGLPVGEPRTIGDRPSTAFGTVLAASGRVLVIGAPGDDSGARDAGSIFVLSFTGGTSYSGRRYAQGVEGVPGRAQAGDRFGSSVAVGEGYVVVGVPHEKDATRRGGWVQPFRIGDDGNLTAHPPLSQGRDGVPGKAEAGDLFGWSVAVLRVCPGVPGVVIGNPAESVGAATQAGSAWLVPLEPGCAPRQVYDAASGLTGGPVELALVGAAVSALRTGPDVADTAVVVAEGISEEGVLGRVLTLAPQRWDASMTVFEGIRLGDDQHIVVSSPAG